MMPALFVAGAHTDVGKTYVACALIRAARKRGLSVDALKPLVSGFDESDWEGSDPGRLIEALGWRHTADTLAALAAPSVMVGGSYLGAISHTLTALTAAKAHGIDVRALVISESATGDAPFAETVESVQRFAKGMLVVAAPRDGGIAFADSVLDACLGARADA